MTDQKYTIQTIAEDMAERIYKVEFYQLGLPAQNELYGWAFDEYVERLADRSEQLLDAQKERI